MQYYFTGGYFLFVTLLLRNVGSVVIPDPSILQITGQNQLDDFESQTKYINTPSTILAGTFISSSVCSLIYWCCEEVFSLTLGKSNEFRSY
jgi:hypothetical protein